MSHGSAISFTRRSTGSWAITARNGESMSTSCIERASAAARSKRKPSTPISVTQYRSESVISRSTWGRTTCRVLPQPV